MMRVVLLTGPSARSLAQEDTELGPIGELVLRMTGDETIAGIADIVVGVPLRILLIILVAYILSRLVRRGIRHFVEEMQEEETVEKVRRLRRRTGLALLDTDRQPSLRRAQRAESIGALLRSTSTVVIWGIAVLTILGELRIPLGPVLAGAGIVGIAVGFGAQNLVRDFLSGIFMLIEDQFGVGDIVDTGQAVGVVEGISLRTTRLRAIDGAVWHVPNGEISRVGNLSQEWSRVVLDVEVAYATDLDRAADVIKSVADGLAADEEWQEFVLEEPEIWGVETLGASGIAIRLVIKTTPFERWRMTRELRRRIKAAFDAEGIEIPFPQRTMWLRTDEAGKDAPPVIHVGSGAESSQEEARRGGADRPAQGTAPAED